MALEERVTAYYTQGTLKRRFWVRCRVQGKIWNSCPLTTLQ